MIIVNINKLEYFKAEVIDWLKLSAKRNLSR